MATRSPLLSRHGTRSTPTAGPGGVRAQTAGPSTCSAGGCAQGLYHRCRQYFRRQRRRSSGGPCVARTPVRTRKLIVRQGCNQRQTLKPAQRSNDRGHGRQAAGFRACEIPRCATISSLRTIRGIMSEKAQRWPSGLILAEPGRICSTPRLQRRLHGTRERKPDMRVHAGDQHSVDDSSAANAAAS